MSICHRVTHLSSTSCADLLQRTPTACITSGIFIMMSLGVCFAVLLLPACTAMFNALPGKKRRVWNEPALVAQSVGTGGTPVV